MTAKFERAKEILKLETDEIKLCERATEIDIRTENKLLREITTALKATIEKENLTSLSAPAIGYNKRVFCIKFKEEIKTFINPVIMNAKGLQLSREHCSSIPGVEYIVPRNTDITLIYQKQMGKIETRQIVGLSAFVVQHEMQHLDGLLLSDIGLELDENWDTFTDEEKQEIIDLYLESLDLRSKELDKEMKEDPELKQMSDAIDFMTSVYKGETKIEKEIISPEE